MKTSTFIPYFLAFLFLPGVTFSSDADITRQDRWYTDDQVKQGAAVFSKHCAECHGQHAQGLAEDWRQKLPDGSYPPPPLNGSAHAWHHSLSSLKRTVRDGGIRLGGKMPPFKYKLSDEEIESVIAFFQDKWIDEVYAAWLQRGGLK